MSGSGGGDGGGDFQWPWGDLRPVPFPLTSVPVMIKELIGRKCRVLSKGDMVTQEIEPGRVNIFLGDNGRIVDIYLEPDLAER
ncbi:I78 family peptidase inhibitor [Pseudomonas farris]